MNDNSKFAKFHGIIHYITEKRGGNVHHEGIVDVTSSLIFLHYYHFLAFLMTAKASNNKLIIYYC